MLLAKSMKITLRETFSVLKPEQCMETRNYKYSFNRKFHNILPDGIVVVLLLFFMFVHLVYSSFGCVTIVSREMKMCQCYLIYDKANWVCS